MITTLALIFALLPATIFGIGYPACPPGWVSLPGSYTCYKFFYDPLPWIGAKAYCSSLLPNSALLIVDNAPEANLVGSLTQGAEIWVGDELGSPYGQPNCLKAIVVGGIQKLALAPCNAPYPYVCELDISPNPCYPQPAYNALATYYPHPTLPYKYIQCTTDGRNFVQLCAKGTVWNQAIYTCDFPPAPPPPHYKKKRSVSYYQEESDYGNPSYGNSYKDDNNYGGNYGGQQGYDDNNYHKPNTYDFERLAPIKLPNDYTPANYNNYGPANGYDKPKPYYPNDKNNPTYNNYEYTPYKDSSYGSPQAYDSSASASYDTQYSPSSYNNKYPSYDAEGSYDSTPYKSGQTSSGSSYPSKPYGPAPYKSAKPSYPKLSSGKRPSSSYSKPSQAYKPRKGAYKRPVSNSVSRYNVTGLDASYGGSGKASGSYDAPKQYDVGYKEEP